MKRKGNLFDRIISLENLRKADAIARMGKLKQRGVKEHVKNEEANLLALHEILKAGTYRTSPYRTFPVYEPKERLVYELPYFPDRIVHHAIMNILEPIFVANFTADTYSCIKGRGIGGAFRNLKQALQDEAGTTYCLKLDIIKFYPSVDHKILKQLLRRKFKDDGLLAVLDEIIDSAPGLPIGNYLSQYFANFYLSGLDHYIKEVLRIKNYFRYADDIIILASDKPTLHSIRVAIQEYLRRLKLDLKGNYQVFPVASRGIDVFGYVFYHTYILLRKSIKKSFARLVATKPSLASIASYYGWACHANCNHLLNKLLSHEKFQRLRHQAHRERIHRRQNKDRPVTESGDHSPRFQDQSFHAESRDRLPYPADRDQRTETYCLHRSQGAHRDD